MSENEESTGRKGFRNFAKKILQEDGIPTVSLDPKELLSSVLELSDKARTETVRLVAKEFRGYLEALELKDDVHDFLTSYSIEVNASFRLKPVNKESNTSKDSTDSKDTDTQSDKDKSRKDTQTVQDDIHRSKAESSEGSS